MTRAHAAWFAKTILAAILLVVILTMMAVAISTPPISQRTYAAEPQVKPECKPNRPCPSKTPTPTATPTSAPTPTPTPTPGPWTLAFDDQYTTWDPSRYFIYPSSWNNHYTGWYGTDITSNGSYARVHLYTDATGTPRIGAFCPIPVGSLSGRGDLESMAVEFRLRADRMVGYKGVPLLWPMSGVWPRDGEIDGPESHFDQRPSAFMHRQDATSGSDQDWYPYPTGTSWQDWHVYRTEWIDGTSAEFFIDGVSIGRSTWRVPNTPMHLVMQFETQLSMTKPDASVNGYVEIDYLKVWAKTP